MEQMTIWDLLYEKKVITKPIRLIELFSGIGSQAKALERLKVNFEHYKTCEWAYNSIIAYNYIHTRDFKDYSNGLTKEQLIDYLDGNISTNYNEPTNVKKKPEKWLRNIYNNCKATHNLMNIMKVKGSDLEIVETDKYEYIMTYSFPCQDLSLAGQRLGMSVSQKDGGTRSGLLWEVERILTELNHEQRPQILLLENVPQVVCKDFTKWQARLNELGYRNYVDILNAKDYGIPQNRKRCFMVSVKGDYYYDFPTKFKLDTFLKDLLEDEVDQKYYLTEKMIKGMESTQFNSYKLEHRLQDVNGVCDTLTTSTGNRCPHCIKIKNATKKGYLEAEEGDGIDISGRMKYHRGTVQKGISQTITTAGGENIGVVIKQTIEKGETHE